MNQLMKPWTSGATIGGGKEALFPWFPLKFMSAPFNTFWKYNALGWSV